MLHIPSPLKKQAGFLMLMASVTTASVGALPMQAAAQQDSSANVSFSTTTPEEWPLTETADRWIEDLTPNQTIHNGIVQDPTRADIVYFATTAPITAEDGGSQTLLSIYRYNTDTLIYERLYRLPYGQGRATGLNAGATPRLGVVGYDNGKVIVLLDDADRAFATCSQSVLRGAEASDGARLMSVPSDFERSWQEGLSDYTPSDTVINQARDMQRQCEAR